MWHNRLHPLTIRSGDGRRRQLCRAYNQSDTPAGTTLLTDDFAIVGRVENLAYWWLLTEMFVPILYAAG